jgi:hypothetical protein
MIDRTFLKYKFFRTHIGGSSKKHEVEIFKKVQGIEEDGSDCDWFEYRKMLVQYFDDLLNVIFSWKVLLKNLSYIFAIFSIFLLFKGLLIFIIIFSISFIFQILYLFLKNKIRKRLGEYNMCLTIILYAIKEQTGFEFDKN